MADRTRQPDEQAERQGRWPGWVTWLVQGTVGWVAYEMSAQPMLGVVAVCAKFGWNDFLTARWLSRLDPNRPRGHACFWLYFSSGLWKTAAAGLLMLLVSPLFCIFNVPGFALQGGAPPTFFGGMI